jgi:hypothetical protein
MWVVTLLPAHRCRTVALCCRLRRGDARWRSIRRYLAVADSASVRSPPRHSILDDTQQDGQQRTASDAKGGGDGDSHCGPFTLASILPNHC